MGSWAQEESLVLDWNINGSSKNKSIYTLTYLLGAIICAIILLDDKDIKMNKMVFIMGINVLWCR